MDTILLSYNNKVVKLLKILDKYVQILNDGKVELVNKYSIHIDDIKPKNYSEIYIFPVILNHNELLKNIIQDYQKIDFLLNLRSSIKIVYNIVLDLYYYMYNKVKIMSSNKDYRELIKKYKNMIHIYDCKNHLLFILNYCHSLDSTIILQDDILDPYIINKYTFEDNIIMWFYIFSIF